MTGPKLNEKSFVAGERSGTKASAMYLRSSASKARVVLDLVRGLPVRQADEVLQFTDREIATTIRKVLASAVANAQHNDEQDPEELFIKACFADEGPTLKRFTPRARGRAGRIKKRTCHITIVVARLDDARLEVVQARDAKRTAAGRRRGAAAGGGAASRRDRVARSRARAESLRGGTTDGTGAGSGETSTSDIPSDDLIDAVDSTESVTDIVEPGAGEVVTSDAVDAGEATQTTEVTASVAGADAATTSRTTESSEPGSGTTDSSASETTNTTESSEPQSGTSDDHATARPNPETESSEPQSGTSDDHASETK
jgi:large subunit ribosomal protein L22